MEISAATLEITLAVYHKTIDGTAIWSGHTTPGHAVKAGAIFPTMFTATLLAVAMRME